MKKKKKKKKKKKYHKKKCKVIGKIENRLGHGYAI